MDNKNHTKKIFAEVILPLAASGTYTYEIPEEFIGAKPGSRVLVSFGKKKIYAGIIKNVHTNQPDYNTKPLLDLPDKSPVVSPTDLKFWEWMADYYMCTQGEVCEAALPAMLKIHSETKIFAAQAALPDNITSPDLQKAFIAIASAKEISLQELQVTCTPAKAVRLVRQLSELNLIGLRESITEKFKPKTIRQLRLNPVLAGPGKVSEKDIARSPAQKKVLHFFWQHRRAYARNELKENTGVSDAVIKSMIEKAWITEENLRIDRLQTTDIETEPLPVLSQAQQQTYNAIWEHWQNKRPVLLYGVTSSGKTEVYFHLLSRCIEAGKQTLVLLPEIALTGQLVKRFKKIFGSKVAVYHSRIPSGARVEMWQKIRSNSDFQIVIGPRSAIFLPWHNLDCIIVDEEHDRSYKQQNPAPRYNARDAAIVLAHLHKANILMGTATPSLESLANHKAGKYELVKLTERFGNFNRPEIIIADYAKWYRRHKVKAHLTPVLYNAMETSLEQHKQVILFQNRRGFSPYLQCFDCGHIPLCPHCDVRLTYHKNDNKLICHYCGYTRKNTGKCPECSNTNMKTMGFGTEKIEEEIQILFPQAQIARFDQDATRRKNAHEKIIERFDAGSIDILVGTQMVTKGLDFKNVDLVGVLNADNLFSFPDFRSFERSMQLLMQVSGRAGRHGNHGKVIIQTSQTNHAVIQFLQKANFGAFAEHELQERHQFAYPPFTRLIAITIKHKKYDVCNRAARILAQKCKAIQGATVLGPQPPAIARIQQYHIMELFIKMKRSPQTLAIKQAVTEAIQNTSDTEGLKSVIIQPDMDPY